MDFALFLSQLELWRRGRPEKEVALFVEELFNRYLKANDAERQAMRRVVTANRDLWDVTGNDDIGLYLSLLASATVDGRLDSADRGLQHLRGWLITVSLTGGCGDWRDTICVLERLRERVEAEGIATQTLFETIAATADAGDSHGVSGMSTRDLIWMASGSRFNL